MENDRHRCAEWEGVPALAAKAVLARQWTGAKTNDQFTW